MVQGTMVRYPSTISACTSPACRRRGRRSVAPALRSQRGTGLALGARARRERACISLISALIIDKRRRVSRHSHQMPPCEPRGGEMGQRAKRGAHATRDATRLVSDLGAHPAVHLDVALLRRPSSHSRHTPLAQAPNHDQARDSAKADRDDDHFVGVHDGGRRGRSSWSRLLLLVAALTQKAGRESYETAALSGSFVRFSRPR